MLLGIASYNPHKIREFKTLLKEISRFDLVSMRDFPDYTPPEETGASFEENAIIKAKHFAKFINGYALADDSGLVVPHLAGAPGVHSARYAGPNASDAENRFKLRQALLTLKEGERSAHFECVLALSDQLGNIKKITKGLCEGYLLTEERGRNDFGYDPLFVRHDYNKTFGELDESTKNRISHRRKAFDKMVPILDSLLHR
jgi:XTP/dITP diphosphohydrolase